MALSVTTCKQYLYDGFLSEDKMKTFFHGHSYTGNPTACAAALASLDLFDANGFEDNIKRIHRSHLEFTERLKIHGSAVNVRCTGTILAFEYANEEVDSYFNNIRDILYDAFIAKGVLLRPLGNTIYIMPPYVITNEELQLAYSAIIETLDDLQISK